MEEKIFDLQDWLEKRMKMKQGDSDSIVEVPVQAVIALPPLFQAIPNLPVSLLPAPPLTDNFSPEQWGKM